MTLYQAYYDASGSENDVSRPLAVAGLLAPFTVWNSIDGAWSKVLAEFGVASLHVKDLAHWKGPYSGWKGDESKRASFVSRLIGVLKGRVQGFAFAVRPADFKAVNQTYRFRTKYWSGAYSFAAWGCIRATHDWFATRHSRTPIQHFLEHGDTGQGVVVASALRSQFPVFAERKFDPAKGVWITPFQAADLLAYECARRNANRYGPERHEMRPWLRALARAMPIQVQRIGREFMIRTCQTNPDEFPPRSTQDAGSIALT